MMPVSGERSAAAQESAGSRRRAAAPSISSSPSTPLARPWAWSAASPATSLSCVATMSLPHLRCGTPWEAQNSYSSRRLGTHSRARAEPVG